MPANYTDVDGAKVAKWGDSDEPIQSHDGSVEEMYFEEGTGNLVITVDVGNGEVYDIQIPVKATKSWNGFVNSLPAWE